MEAITTFLLMDGYAAFVWPAYGLSAVVLVTMLWRSLAFLKSSDEELQRLRSQEKSEPEVTPSFQGAGDEAQA